MIENAIKKASAVFPAHTHKERQGTAFAIHCVSSWWTSTSDHTWWEAGCFCFVVISLCYHSTCFPVMSSRFLCSYRTLLTYLIIIAILWRISKKFLTCFSRVHS